MSQLSGSEIAKGGFQNEEEVAQKFNNWKNDKDAQKWLELMYYNLEEITDVHAQKIGEKGYKSDVNVKISIVIKRVHGDRTLESAENIQVKLVSNETGFNQVEKGKVDKYVEKWHIDEKIIELLKLYDGETSPRNGSRNPKRMFIDEFEQDEQKLLLDFFQKNMIMIISDVIRGRGRFAAEWTLVINKSDGYKWRLMAVNEAVSIYAGDCNARMTSSGNIKLGNISLQRKGGDGGADTANMLQFKSNPMILF